MAGILFAEKKYTATASNHISYTNKEYAGQGGGGTDYYGNPIPTYPEYDYPTRKADATITGTTKSSVTNVTVQGKAPVVSVSGSAQETDTFTLPSTATTSGSGMHTNVNVTLTGNSKNVYINGKLAVLASGTAQTHVSGVTASLASSLGSTTVQIG